MADNGGRGDGREDAQMRAMACETGTLNRADGSAAFDQGNTSVLASVFAMHSIRVKHESAEKATVDVTWIPRTGRASVETEGLAVNLRGTVEAVIVSKLHPRSGISVTIQETSTDGALFAAAVNAAALALSDAGVPLKSLCTAATVALMGDDRFVLDPNAAEEEEAVATFTMCFAAPSVEERAEGKEAGLITSVTTGSYSPDAYFEAVRLCRSGAGSARAFVQLALKRVVATNPRHAGEGDEDNEKGKGKGKGKGKDD